MQTRNFICTCPNCGVQQKIAIENASTALTCYRCHTSLLLPNAEEKLTPLDKATSGQRTILIALGAPESALKDLTFEQANEFIDGFKVRNRHKIEPPKQPPYIALMLALLGVGAVVFYGLIAALSETIPGAPDSPVGKKPTPLADEYRDSVHKNNLDSLQQPSPEQVPVSKSAPLPNIDLSKLTVGMSLYSVNLLMHQDGKFLGRMRRQDNTTQEKYAWQLRNDRQLKATFIAKKLTAWEVK